MRNRREATHEAKKSTTEKGQLIRIEEIVIFALFLGLSKGVVSLCQYSLSRMVISSRILCYPRETQ